jgi:hypothetical protein
MDFIFQFVSTKSISFLSRQDFQIGLISVLQLRLTQLSLESEDHIYVVGSITKKIKKIFVLFTKLLVAWENPSELYLLKDPLKDQLQT